MKGSDHRFTLIYLDPPLELFYTGAAVEQMTRKGVRR